jgi:soluble lytic murein transglycosylase-like protein
MRLTIIAQKTTIAAVLTVAVCALAPAASASPSPIVLAGPLFWNSRATGRIGGGPFWANRNYDRNGLVNTRHSVSVMTRIQSAVDEASRLYEIAPELIMAVIRRESNFNPRAVGTSGEQGLMQLAPATGRAMGVSDPFNVRENVMGGAKYLAQLFRRFEGDYVAGLAAYNVGPTAVEAHGGLPPSLRAVDYVRAVLGFTGGGAPGAGTPESVLREPERSAPGRVGSRPAPGIDPSR